MAPEADPGFLKRPDSADSPLPELFPDSVAFLTASITEATDESEMIEVESPSSSSSMTFLAPVDLSIFFQAVLGLSMDPKEPREESESVSMMAKVLSPILEMLLMEGCRSRPELYSDPPQE